LAQLLFTPLYRLNQGIFSLIILLALLALAGCSGNAAGPPASDATPAPSPAADASPAAENEAEDSSPVPTGTASPYDKALEAYKSVLERNDMLQDFLAETAESGKTLTPARFAILDLDGDGIPEAVVELSDEYPYFYQILHFENGVLYGNFLSVREFGDLKEDGSFAWSGGAGDNGYGRLRFNASEYVVEKLAYIQTSTDGDDVSVSYYIGDEPVTREEYDAFVSEQENKPAARWRDYTQENIDDIF